MDPIYFKLCLRELTLTLSSFRDTVDTFSSSHHFDPTIRLQGFLTFGWYFPWCVSEFLPKFGASALGDSLISYVNLVDLHLDSLQKETDFLWTIDLTSHVDCN